MPNELGVVWGWKDIARLIGCSVRWCQQQARDNRLPVLYIGRRPVATARAVREWLSTTAHHGARPRKGAK